MSAIVSAENLAIYDILEGQIRDRLLFIMQMAIKAKFVKMECPEVTPMFSRVNGGKDFIANYSSTDQGDCNWNSGPGKTQTVALFFPTRFLTEEEDFQVILDYFKDLKQKQIDAEKQQRLAADNFRAEQRRIEYEKLKKEFGDVPYVEPTSFDELDYEAKKVLFDHWNAVGENQKKYFGDFYKDEE